jgi:hypothetical protein
MVHRIEQEKKVMVAHLHTMVNTGMSRQEKEEVVYGELMANDRTFAKNCREMDLRFDFGSDAAQRFLVKIEKAEKAIGRKLDATEIEIIYQQIIA